MKNCFKLENIVKPGDIIGLGTCNNNIINIVACKILKVSKNDIILGDVLFKKTLKNILENNNITIYTTQRGYFQLKGKGKYYNNDKNILLVNNLLKQINYYQKSKGMLKIKINKIFKL